MGVDHLVQLVDKDVAVSCLAVGHHHVVDVGLFSAAPSEVVLLDVALLDIAFVVLGHGFFVVVVVLPCWLRIDHQ